MKTPAWGNSSAGPEPAKDAAAPRTWRGVGEWGEDWGELNVGKQPPAVFVLDLEGFRVQRVHSRANTQGYSALVKDHERSAGTTTFRAQARRFQVCHSVFTGVRCP